MVTRNVDKFTLSYPLSKTLKKAGVRRATGIQLKGYFLKDKNKRRS